MSSGKLVLGILAGVAVGAIAGILFAPEKGSKTRKKILSKGKDYVAALQAKYDDLVDTLSKKADGAKGDAAELIANVRAKHS
jgi:gas vesicle protein